MLMLIAVTLTGPLFFQPNHLILRTNGKVKGVWIEPVAAQIVGELKEWAQSAGVECVRIPGYWINREEGVNGGREGGLLALITRECG